MSISTDYIGNEVITTTTDMVSGMILSVERKTLPECDDQECMQLRRQHNLGNCYAPNAIGDHYRWYDFVTSVTIGGFVYYGGDMSCYE